jgi:hypothetical protein
MSMHADAAKLLWDARQAVQRVARFVEGKSFDDYLQDDLLRSAVERNSGSLVKRSTSCAGWIRTQRRKSNICRA